LYQALSASSGTGYFPVEACLRVVNMVVRRMPLRAAAANIMAARRVEVCATKGIYVGAYENTPVGWMDKNGW
jgi:hypothetical protein